MGWFCYGIIDGEDIKDNKIPNYYLEPRGFIIAEIIVRNIFKCSYYGYIRNEDYRMYLADKMPKTIVMLHPYKKDKRVFINTEDIITISAGTYKNLELYGENK